MEWKFWKRQNGNERTTPSPTPRAKAESPAAAQEESGQAISDEASGPDSDTKARRLARVLGWRPSLPADEVLARIVRRWLPWVAFLILVFVGTVMAVQLWPHRLPHKQHPNFLDNMFDSRIMVWGGRMLLFVGVTYAVGSVAALISQNRWLSDFGPFKVSEWVGKVEQSVEALNKQLDKQAATIDDLVERLERRDEEVRALTDERDQLLGGVGADAPGAKE